MEKKKILIVCRSFYPQNTPRSHRATELAKEFARQGHEVTVLGPNLSGNQIEFAGKHLFSIKDIGSLRWKAPDFGKSRIGYLFSRATVRFLQLGFEFPDIELLFLVTKALRSEKNYDLLISIAVPYPIHWGVAYVWNKNQTIADKWIADCGDPYMGCTTDSFKKWFYFKYIEKWFMRKANAIAIPVESARSSYYQEFHDKIRIIPQGFKISPIISNEKHKNEKTSFAYAGGFIPGIRDPRAFLEYLSNLPDDFIFYVFTNTPDLIADFQKKLGKRLKIRNYVEREALLQFLHTMDFLVNFDNNTEAAVPSKLIDYAIVGKPVLNVKKEMDNSIINQFLNGDYHSQMSVGNIDQYRIENVAAQFLELIKS